MKHKRKKNLNLKDENNLKMKSCEKELRFKENMMVGRNNTYADDQILEHGHSFGVCRHKYAGRAFEN